MQIDIKTLFDSIERQPVDTLTAYRDCLFVMLHCAPLRLNELLSINPDNAEVWHTTPGGTKQYRWRYKSSRTINTSEEVFILIPDSLVEIAQKAISRLRELQQDMIPSHYSSLAKDRELRANSIKIRRDYAEALSRESDLTPWIDLVKTSTFDSDKRNNV